MKSTKYLFLLLGFFINAQQKIRLEQCYQLAKENYPLIKSRDLIEQSKNYNLENATKAWWPQIQIIGQATYQNQVTELPVKIPNSTIEPLSKDQYKVFADVQQNIYDGGVTKNQKKITEIKSKVDLQKNEIELEQLKQRINQIYFGILFMEEQLAQSNLTKQDLENGLKKAEAQLKNGVIFRSHVEVIKSQLITLEQKQIELLSTKKSYLDRLSIFIKKNISQNDSLIKPEKILLSKENNQPELKLFDLQKQALESQKSLLNSKNLPKLGAFLQAGYGKPGYNFLKNEFDIFYMGGIRLNIPISGFYTKKNELALLETQQQEIEIQRENFLFNQKLQTLQNENELQKIQDLIDKDNEVIILRESIKNASLAQLQNGVITTNDYLREVNAEDQAKNQKIQHEIQFLLTQYQLKAQLNN